MADTSRQIFERYLRALNSQDLATTRELIHPDFEDSYPQSGEVIRGAENLIAMLTNYPGALQGLGTQRIVGGEERFVRSPLFTIIRVEGNDDTLTGIQRIKYPDGSVWLAVILCEMRDGLVWRIESYFAPLFDPPAWRAAWVEIRPRPTE
jgi:SnoaL-like domain